VNKTIAIVQARLGSTRLPFKMMLSLHGKPIIEWAIRRIQRSKLLNDIIVAIPETEDNDLLGKFIQELGVKVYRGSEGNVLERFYKSVENEGAIQIVRVRADNPLIDGNEIDSLITFFEKTACDYSYNHIPKNNSYPDGLGAEIISFNTLKHLYKVVETQHHKEHCLPYFTENSNMFDIKTFDPLDEKLHHPGMRFDVDTFDDYQALCMKDFDMDISSQNLIKLFMEKVS